MGIFHSPFSSVRAKERPISMVDGVSGTRASIASYTDANNIIQSAAINVPRHDYILGVYQGLLIEGSRTNYLLHNEDLSDVVWEHTNNTASVNSTVAPDGNTTADKLIPTATTGLHYSKQITSIVAGTEYTQSMYVKAGGYDILQITASAGWSGASSIWVNFDLTKGYVTNFGVSSNMTFAMKDVGNGWYRCSITTTADTTTSGRFLFGALSSDIASRVPSFTGNGTSGLHIWRPQLEAGSSSTSSIATTTSSVTRSADNIQTPWTINTGIFFTEVIIRDLDTEKRIFSVNDTTSNNRIILRNLSGAYDLTVITNGTTVGNINGGSFITGPAKIAIKITQSSIELIVNGTSIGTTTLTGGLPIITQLSIGEDYSGANQLNGYLQNFDCYVTLTTEEMKEITFPDYIDLNQKFVDVGTSTRASTGTYLEYDGILKTAAINEARYEYGQDGILEGLLIEEASTNFHTQSENLTHTDWLKGSGLSVTDSSIASVIDGVNWFSLTANTSAGSYKFFRQNLGNTSGDYASTFYVKKDNYRYIGIRPKGSLATHATFDLDTGTWVVTPTGHTVSAELVGIDTWRIEAVKDSGDELSGFSGLAIVDVSGNELNAIASGSNVYAVAGQNEVGSSSSSYIKTTTASATRSADIASTPTIPWFNPLEGTIICEVSSYAISTHNYILAIQNPALTNNLLLFGTTGSAVTLVSYIAGVNKGQIDVSNSWVNDSSLIKIGFSFTATDMYITVDGSTIATTALTAPVATDLFNMFLGERGDVSGTRATQGHIKSIHYYPLRLSDTQLQNLTGLPEITYLTDNTGTRLTDNASNALTT